MRQAVIVSYARTGLAKAARGGFNNTRSWRCCIRQAIAQTAPVAC